MKSKSYLSNEAENKTTYIKEYKLTITIRIVITKHV